MAQHKYHRSWKLLCILIIIPLCLLCCTHTHVPPKTTSVPKPEKIMITDIGKISEDHKTSLIVYSNQMVNYTSFAQQDPPSVVLDIPDVYLHKNLKPMNFSEGPIKTVIPEQILSEERLQTRLTIKMIKSFPYEIQREKNQLRINFKQYTDISTSSEMSDMPLPPQIQTESLSEVSQDSQEKSDVPLPQIQAKSQSEASKHEEKLDESNTNNVSEFKSSRIPIMSIPERKILRSIPDIERMTKSNTPQYKLEKNNTIEAHQKSFTEKISEKKIFDDQVDIKGLLLDKKQYNGKPISLDFQNADIRSVLRIIADVSEHNLVIDPEVKGKVDITLIKPVPWDQALEVILKTNKLTMKMEGNIIRVGLPNTFASEKDAELKAIQANRKAKEEATKVLPLETKIVPINYATADVLMNKLTPMLSKPEGLAEPASIVVDERTNTLIIKDLPEVIDEIISVIKILDRPTPQVMIEARIVETNKNFAKDLGIRWGGTYSRQTNYRFPNTVEVSGVAVDQYAVNLPIGSQAFGAIGINLGHINGSTSLDLELRAMETRGRGKIISNPRIATLDNEQATITSGHKIPYQTTDAEGNPSTSFVEAAINLTVTPQITPDNNITMKIQADKSEPDWSRTVAGAPSIITRKAITRLIVTDGDTAVIGGLAQHNEQSNERKVPFFGDIPILNYLFKAKDKTDGFDELLIFITPRIIKDENIKKAEFEGF